jgi:hypothetical protein
MAPQRGRSSDLPTFLTNVDAADLLVAFILEQADRVEKEAAEQGMSQLVAAYLRSVRRSANEVRARVGLDDEPVSAPAATEFGSTYGASQ